MDKCRCPIPIGGYCALHEQNRKRQLKESPWFWIGLVIIVFAVGWWAYSEWNAQRAFAARFDVLPDPGWSSKLGYWKFRGDSVMYPPSIDPLDILRETYVNPPSFKDLR